MINLEGLTEQQVKIADLLWSCDTEAEIQQLKRAVPQNLQRDVETVHQLMLAAVFDQYTDVDEGFRDYLLSLR